MIVRKFFLQAISYFLQTNLEMGKKRVIAKSEEKEEGEKPEDGGVLASSGSAEIARTRGGKFMRGVAHIQATYNNTIITISDDKGNVLAQSSAGALGFSGAKKATPFAAARVAEAVVEKIRKSGIQEILVRVSGVGSGRDSAVRALANHGLNIISIRDVTPLPHNGPRAKKVRRV